MSNFADGFLHLDNRIIPIWNPGQKPEYLSEDNFYELPFLPGKIPKFLVAKFCYKEKFSSIVFLGIYFLIDI